MGYCRVISMKEQKIFEGKKFIFDFLLLYNLKRVVFLIWECIILFHKDLVRWISWESRTVAQLWSSNYTASQSLYWIISAKYCEILCEVRATQKRYIFSVPRPTLKSYFYELMRFLKKVSENKKIRIFSTLNHIH